MKIYKNCQSCGMPFKKDPKGSGTNADGQPSIKYCSFCYEKGEFLQPDITLQEMQDFVKEKLKELGGIMKLFAGPFSKGISRLERWKKN